VAQVEDEITVPKLDRPLFIRPAAPAPSAPSRPVPGDRPSQDSAPWLVQLELTTREFALFRGSALNRGAVAWREGMPDWRPLDAIDKERQWQPTDAELPPPPKAPSSEPPPMAISEPPQAPRSPMAAVLDWLRQHSVVSVAVLGFTALLLLMWWGPVQTARDAALRAELAVQRLTPIVERVLASLDARAAEAANRNAPLPAATTPPVAAPTSPPEAAASATPSAAPEPPSAPSPAASTPKPQATRLDRARLASALSAAVAKAEACGPNASGSLSAIVTFGPNGVVRAVSLGSAPSGVDRSCVSRALQSARGRPYEGEPITIKRVIKF
jgi:hypothetical protein